MRNPYFNRQEWLVFVASLLCCAPLCFGAAETPNTTDPASISSPDGRFEFRLLMEVEDGNDSFGIFDRQTKKPVRVEKDETLLPMGDALRCIWAPDSQHFALNVRVGARSDTTQLSEWTGEKFRRLPELDLALSGELAEIRKDQLKKAGISADTPFRRISDTYLAVQWSNNVTLLVAASSERSYMDKSKTGGEVSIVSGSLFVLKLDGHGGWDIIGPGAPADGQSPAETAAVKK